MLNNNKTLTLIKYNKDSVPKSLVINPLLIALLCSTEQGLFHYNVDALKSFGYEDVITFWDPKEGYIYAKGNMPVCLCAHMDRVYNQDVKKYIPSTVLNSKKKIIDVYISSKQGIGGDDRCGVYAILEMLKLGHRPSVLFFMGEERGCLGSHKFCKDFPSDFLSDVNAFIQIDRRGNKDVVCYSDANESLTKAIEAFDFKSAIGSCSDISVLMPHFGISGVNLSSGYYHEHSGANEYVSVKDVNYLLKRLNNILSSDIFKERYVYERRSYPSYFYGNPLNRYEHSGLRFHSKKDESIEQLSLIKDLPYIDDKIDRCFFCGEHVDKESMVLVYPDNDYICPDCVPDFLNQGYIQCPYCGCLNLPFEDDDHVYCGHCNQCIDEEL